MKYHFIGIKGTGMSALAQIIKMSGNEVTGSDVEHHLFTEDALRNLGIEIYSFDEKNIKEDMIIVQGNAFTDENPEVRKAKEMNLKIYKYFELLGELTKKYNTIAICGCHGKTTTTSLLSHVFNNPVGTNYLIGDGTGYANSKNNNFIIEACEYKRHFLYYYPKYTIVTNIELDHVDYYKDIDDVIDAYTTFMKQTENTIIACGDDENIRKINIDKEIIYYGFNDNNDVIAKNVVMTVNGSEFDVHYKNKFLGHFNLPLYGNHMVLNALSVIIVSHLQGIELSKVHDLIETFKGAKRRFSEEFFGDIVVIDDYAHHPSEIRATINAARQKYPNKEIVSVYMPNTFSRPKDLKDDFIEVFKLADKAYMTNIFSDREKAEDFVGVSSEMIINEVENAEVIHLKAPNIIEKEDITSLLKHKNAVVIFMSCKEIYYLKEKYESYIK